MYLKTGNPMLFSVLYMMNMPCTVLYSVQNVHVAQLKSFLVLWRPHRICNYSWTQCQPIMRQLKFDEWRFVYHPRTVIKKLEIFFAEVYSDSATLNEEKVLEPLRFRWTQKISYKVDSVWGGEGQRHPTSSSLLRPWHHNAEKRRQE
jgi:hypothetical protein